ncbi:MAG: hypothetical protein IJI98_01465 [Methanosphaera sp.]|uniref:hypothetical protein n=1 Tax=Methanosphaera sp. ISO3-F5 TaxID=1452353 RepID=UPI002B25CBAF|nr:hypothetical protein [Methanosphaera sp. ISO3-F5]MBR0471351.1 hypothetical protein [Methanosphaera sp.]WQH64130.1 hypothetical protein PXD04_10545 [Methanosphaera sp. ISO3-F5]
MYERIFGKYPQVKVINYVLTNPERTYSKKEMAVGANISRVTLDSFIKDIVELGILNKEGLSYTVNLKSKIVKTLVKTQIMLADIIMNDELEKSEEIIGEALTDDEFEKFMDSFDYEMDIDSEIEKIERGEISVTKEDYVDMVNKGTKIFSSNTFDSNIILTQYINQDYDKGSINYG